jgi:hypothetical protein
MKTNECHYELLSEKERRAFYKLKIIPVNNEESMINGVYIPAENITTLMKFLLRIKHLFFCQYVGRVLMTYDGVNGMLSRSCYFCNDIKVNKIL